jgi:hypothetical protein
VQIQWNLGNIEKALLLHGMQHEQIVEVHRSRGKLRIEMHDLLLPWEEAQGCW